MNTNPLKSLLVLVNSIWTGRLIRERNVRKDVPVSLILEILLVFENGIEIVHPSTGQKSNISDHASHAADGESPSTEADENNFISWCIIGRDETVDLTNVLHSN